MAQYIDKSALVAEIERLDGFYHLSKGAGGQAFIESLLSFLDTLEVKKMDLNAAVEHYVEQHKSELSGYFDIRRIARHFFELGLNCQSNGIDYDIDKLIEDLKDYMKEE